MCFTDFPTETYREALATIRLIEQFRDQLALFICGQFDLAPGALVARTPERYGIREIWHVVGDELLTGLFYEEQRPSKSLREREEVDAAIDKLARSWWLHRYPWAGSLSTAHTLLWYDHYGPEVFKRFAGTRQKLTPSYPRKRSASMRFAVEQMAQQAQAHEVAIWHTLIREKRTVTRALYHQLAEALPTMIAISHRLKHVALLSFRNRSSGS
jgi:anaerobic magnesium-protoporphyrin IX monomethyl ester cyclase